MAIIFALGSALSIALGTFLTKSVTIRLPGFSSVGVLFYLNAVVIALASFFMPIWNPMELSDVARALSGGVTTALGAYLIFLVVSRSSASAAGVGQSLSPAAVLVLSPLFLRSEVSPAQVVLVSVIVLAALFPLRTALESTSSLTSFLLMAAIGICTATTTILISLQLAQGMELVQILLIQQVTAGSLFIAFYQPKGFTFSDYLSLSRRSIFMGMGWILTVAALASGSAILVQSVLATVPIWILIMETIAARKVPATNVIVSALLASTGIILLSTVFA
jgi:drug/metabolite transporter (DMT)-like permease